MFCLLDDVNAEHHPSELGINWKASVDGEISLAG